MLVARLLCASYCVFLTIMLLVPDPWALLGIDRRSLANIGVGTHFVFFGVLALLVLSSRIPLPGLTVAGLLVGYAVATECLQSLVPLRSVELRDFAENLLGLAAGAGIWRLLRAKFGL